MPATATPDAPPVRVAPNAGETQTAFVQRADRALTASCPDRRKRMEQIFGAWVDAGRDADLQWIARQQFPAPQFVRVFSRPIFTEHTKSNRDGQSVVYDRAALEAIAANCNHRIRDTGDFAPLIDGHTPLEAGQPQPEVLGYLGPFRVGLIGNVKPRWALFADEWHHAEDVQRLRKLQRRSVEIITGIPVAERWIDSVAALGAENPELDTGLTRFSRADGLTVERYSMSFPGGSSTFAPGTDATSDRYQAGEESMALAPEDIQQIVAAVMQTKPMQWVASQMEAGGPAGGEPPAPKPEDELDEEERQHYSTLDERGRQAYMAGRAAAKKRYGQAEAPAAPPVNPPPAAPAPPATGNPGEMERYSRVSRENENLKQQVEKLSAGLRHKDRYSKLTELNREYDFPLDEEFADVKDLPDAQFEAHTKRIVSRYSRRPENEIPELISPGLAPDQSAKDKERYHRLAVEHAKKELAAGRECSYDDALAHVTKSGAK